MICITCGHLKTSITNSRPQNKKLRTWRRRKCLSCGYVFTTNETVDDTEISISTKDKLKTSFDIGILTTSIYSCFAHDQTLGSSASYWIAMSVKYSLVSTYMIKQKEISTRDIAGATHETLKRYDEIAAIQYAARHGLL